MDWAKRPIDKYSDFSGRASRPEYWWFILAGFTASLIATIVDSIIGFRLVAGYGPLTLLIGLGLLAPSLAVGARRLHDTDRSGWWMLLAIVPLANLLLIYFLVLEG